MASIEAMASLQAMIDLDIVAGEGMGIEETGGEGTGIEETSGEGIGGEVVDGKVAVRQALASEDLAIEGLITASG